MEAIAQNIFFLLINPYMITNYTIKRFQNSEYSFETPLESDIIIPDSFATYKEETIKVMLTQGGKKLKVRIMFMWKQDGTVKYGMEQMAKSSSPFATRSLILFVFPTSSSN
jgi:hypothetical protein